MKIACIIVTYNRCALLQKCISAVKRQSYKKFDIIIVNNGSTDGTSEWLNGENDITVINQENLGGAGGFHNGMKYAYNAGYDYFWIMDDDGIPTPECLQKLFDIAQKGFHYVAPNLVTFEGEYHFAHIMKNAKTPVLNHCGGPFNAILLSRYLIESIGLPNKYYFIWGDEDEFVNRIRESFFHLALVLDAIHNHKKTAQGGDLSKRIFYKVRNMIWSVRLSTGVLQSKKSLCFFAFYNITRYLMIFLIHFKLVAVKDIIRGVYAGFTVKMADLYMGGHL